MVNDESTITKEDEGWINENLPEDGGTSDVPEHDRVEESEPDQEEQPKQPERTIAVKQNNKIAVDKSLDIQGLEDVPSSMLAVPFVKLVQSNSEAVLQNGEEAKKGSYYFYDVKKEVEELKFIMLRAKPVEREFERDGKKTLVKQMLMLGATTTDKEPKLFILILPVSSFSAFGKLIAMFKEKKVSSVWQYEITAKSLPKENDKGKFMVADFSIGNKLPEVAQDRMREAYGEYGGVLERNDVPVEEE